jgi:hypothetical protein
MEIIKWGDIVFLGLVVLVPIALALFILFAKRKGWIRYERFPWRDTENYIRRSRRRSEKLDSMS